MLKIIKYSIIVIILSIIFSLLTLYFYLIKGFSIQNIQHSNITIGKLYIKIDKKIILKTENIYYLSKKSDNKEINFKETDKLIKTLLQYLLFFQEIEIKNLTINQNMIKKIEYKNNHFQIETADIKTTAILTPNNQQTKFNIKELTLKKYNYKLKNIKGSFYSDLLHLYLNIDTIIENNKIKLNIIIGKKIKYKGIIQHFNNSIIQHFIETPPFEIEYISFKGDKKRVDIKMENITLNKDIKNYQIKIEIPKLKLDFLFNQQRIESFSPYFILNLLTKNQNYKIKIFDSNIKYNLQQNTLLFQNEKMFITNFKTSLLRNRIKYKNSKIKIEIKKLLSNYIGKIKGENIFINYNKNATLNIKKLKVNFKQIEANFADIKGVYNNKKTYLNTDKIVLDYKFLKGITINNIKTELLNNVISTKIKNLKIDNILIKNIYTIYKTPILSINFQTDTLLSKKLTTILQKFNINIPIYQTSGKNSIIGKIEYNFQNSKLKNNLKLQVKNSKLMLTETTFLNIKKSQIELNNSFIYLKNSLLEYNQSIINLEYQIKNGVIDLNNSKIQTDGEFKTLSLKDITTIKNYPEKVDIDLKGIDIFLNNLNIIIKLRDKIIVTLNHFSTLTPFISYLKEYKIEDGKSDIVIADRIKINSNIKTKQKMLLISKNPISKIELNTTIQDNNISIKNRFCDIKIVNKKIVKIVGNYKNIDFNVSSIIENNDKNKTKQNENNNSKKIDISLSGKNSAILLNNSKLYSEKIDINYKENNLSVTSIFKDRNLTIYYKNNELKIFGFNFREKDFQNLTDSQVLKDPLFNFFIYRSANSEIFQGFVEIKKGYIKELKLFTNILAFINLIPSLITFQPVGFTQKGYKIKKGLLDFIYYNQIIYLKNIDIKGENLTFTGNGYIDLKNSKINLNLNINLLIKLIKDIPIVSYILLGKDGGITIKITIKGDLTNPKIDKNTASNIIEAPFGIIKRTILTPFRPFINH